MSQASLRNLARYRVAHKENSCARNERQGDGFLPSSTAATITWNEAPMNVQPRVPMDKDAFLAWDAFQEAVSGPGQT